MPFRVQHAFYKQRDVHVVIFSSVFMTLQSCSQTIVWVVQQQDWDCSPEAGEASALWQGKIEDV